VRRKLGATVSRVVVGLVLALAGASFAGAVHAYRAGTLQAEVERLREDLKASKRAIDVEYFARQCDREKREELARCGCSCAEVPR